MPDRMAREGDFRGELEREEGRDRGRGHGARAPAGALAELAAPDRARRRRDRRHRHPHPDRRRRRQGRARRDPLLRHCRPDLRGRRACLCRDGDDDPGLGQRLHLHLCRARRADRLDRRLEPDPRIFAGGERRGRGLVGLCLGLAPGLGGLPGRPFAGAGARRHPQPAGDLHHRGGRRTADLRHQRERDAERCAGRGQGRGFDRLRRGDLALFRPRPVRAIHALRLSQERPAGRGSGGDGGGGDHLLRLLRLRRDRDRRRGDQESGSRPVDRHRRLDGGLRDHLHGGRRRCDRRARLHPLRQQSGAAGADPARDRPADRCLLSRRVGGGGAADGDPRLLLRAEPHLFRDGTRRAAAAGAGAGQRPGLAGADYDIHRIGGRGARRADPARRARRARQCRYADRLHRGLRLHAGDAQARARATRLFRTPWAWPVGIFGILGCLYLLYSLPQRTQIWFLGAQVVGLVLYFAYGARRSVAGRAEA